jgi:hypothetical protein
MEFLTHNSSPCSYVELFFNRAEVAGTGIEDLNKRVETAKDRITSILSGCLRSTAIL